MKWYDRNGKKFRVTSIEIDEKENLACSRLDIKPAHAFRRGLKMLVLERTGADVNSMEAKDEIISKLHKKLTELSTENIILKRDLVRR